MSVQKSKLKFASSQLLDDTVIDTGTSLSSIQYAKTLRDNQNDDSLPNLVPRRRESFANNSSAMLSPPMTSIRQQASFNQKRKSVPITKFFVHKVSSSNGSLSPKTYRNSNTDLLSPKSSSNISQQGENNDYENYLVYGLPNQDLFQPDKLKHIRINKNKSRYQTTSSKNNVFSMVIPQSSGMMNSALKIDDQALTPNNQSTAAHSGRNYDVTFQQAASSNDYLSSISKREEMTPKNSESAGRNPFK